MIYRKHRIYLNTIIDSNLFNLIKLIKINSKNAQRCLFVSELNLQECSKFEIGSIHYLIRR